MDTNQFNRQFILNNSYFEKNRENLPLLKFLKSCSTPSAVFSKSGELTFLFNNKRIHSAIDPRKEAYKKSESIAPISENVLVYSPADLLYLLEVLVSTNKISLKSKILLVYTDPTILKTLLMYRDLTFLEAFEEIPHLYLVPEFTLEKLPFHPSELKGTRYLGAEALTVDFFQPVEHFKATYLELLSTWFSSCYTKFYFDKLWLLSFFRNISVKLNLLPLVKLKDTLTGKRVLVIGAGPSLYKQISILQKIKDSFILVACDTALRPLLLAGITPHFVVSLDSGFYNTFDFEFPSLDSILVTDICAAPAIPRRHRGAVSFFRADVGDENEFRDLIIKHYGLESEVPALSVGGSIGHAAISLAKWLGAKPITLCGLDFSYPFLDSHIISTMHWAYYYRTSNRYAPIVSESTQSLFRNSLEEVAAVGFINSYTSPIMKIYLRWINDLKDRNVEILSPMGQQTTGLALIEGETVLAEGGFGKIFSGEFYKELLDSNLKSDVTFFNNNRFKSQMIEEVENLRSMYESLIAYLELMNPRGKTEGELSIDKLKFIEECEAKIKNLKFSSPYLDDMFNLLSLAASRNSTANSTTTKYQLIKELAKLIVVLLEKTRIERLLRPCCGDNTSPK